MIRTYNVVLPETISKQHIWIAEILRTYDMKSYSLDTLIITDDWVGANNEGTADIDDIPVEWLHKVFAKPESEPEPTISFDAYWYNDHFKRDSFYERIDVEKGWNACKKMFGIED